MNEIVIKRSEVISLKGRINTPSLFNSHSLPTDSIAQLNSILTDILFPTNETQGDNDNENT